MKKINTSVIYKITNILNGKTYVGSAVCFNRRQNEHKRLLKNNKHHSIKLQNSVNKYGLENFVFEILEKIDDKSTLIINEQKWIDLIKPEFNMTLIAGLNSALGLKRSDETKKKISESLKGRKLSQEHINNIKKVLLGKNLSEKHKKNIGLGNKNSEKFINARKNPEYIDKTKNTRKKNGGYVVTDEMKKAISETLKNKNIQTAISIKIEKYDLNNNLLEIYPSIIKAEINNELPKGSLNYNIVKKNKNIYKGFIWKIN